MATLMANGCDSAIFSDEVPPLPHPALSNNIQDQRDFITRVQKQEENITRLKERLSTGYAIISRLVTGPETRALIKQASISAPRSSRSRAVSLRPSLHDRCRAVSPSLFSKPISAPRSSRSRAISLRPSLHDRCRAVSPRKFSAPISAPRSSIRRTSETIFVWSLYRLFGRRQNLRVKYLYEGGFRLLSRSLYLHTKISKHTNPMQVPIPMML